jgi:hypothetical protein
MPTPRALRLFLAVLSTSISWPLLACNQGDLGAPCNHGSVDPPSTKLVTFPALSCDDLLCVYGEEKVILQPDGGCSDDSQCNTVGSEKIFECNTDEGMCTLSLNYVLERSMCSKRCATDDDCRNTSATNRPVAKETACKTGFACARIQQLGEFCCEKLCVCNDDLPSTTELDMNCANSTQPNCCDKMLVPSGCGKP